MTSFQKFKSLSIVKSSVYAVYGSDVTVVFPLVSTRSLDEDLHQNDTLPVSPREFPDDLEMFGSRSKCSHSLLY